MTIEVYHWTRMKVDGSKYFTVRAFNTARQTNRRVYNHTFVSEAASLRSAVRFARNFECMLYFVKNKRRDYPLGVD